MHPRSLWRSFLTVVLAAAGFGTIAACSQATPNCGSGTQPYNGHCLSAATVAYLDCTKDRGFDSSSKIGGGVSGDFRDVVGVSLSFANEKARHEDSPVALQIAQGCLEISKQEAKSAADQSAARDLEQQAGQYFQQWQRSQVRQTPHIRTSRDSGSPGETVTVSGTSFWSGETVDVYVFSDLVGQVPADQNGSFTTKVTVPADLLSGSIDISATGESSSKSARVPFQLTN